MQPYTLKKHHGDFFWIVKKFDFVDLVAMRRAVFLGLVFISCIASSDSLQLRKKSGKHKAKAPADEDAETYANDVASEIEKNIQDVRLRRNRTYSTHTHTH